ncbi:MAG TPA: hypothetical protein VFX58_05130 [Chitinophagaceae bacterium]|nr:hypothetical protein [Chitinophagaceae bacterium]
MKNTKHKNFLHAAGNYLRKIMDRMFHPLCGLPVPDFNHIYDPTIL